MTNPEKTKDKSNDKLDTLISKVSMTDKIFILGDLNARVGTDHNSWEGTIGRYGVGKYSSNGIVLLRTCIANDLLVTNIVFRQANTKQPGCLALD